MFGARTDAIVEQFEVGKRSLSQPRGESAGRLIEVGFSQLSPIATDHIVRSHFGNISRKEHLQGTFTRLTSRTHKVLPRTAAEKRHRFCGVTQKLPCKDLPIPPPSWRLQIPCSPVSLPRGRWPDRQCRQ